ncbi:DUF4190 domain-containing protein [Amycolatopsis sp. NBC_01286]|uniref:DUF4190 domain-containing protein n=1 Tax=Amycolatopsis sp. NBC_01286 TaxID=2903560 RepID=UPI002E10095A|nr:DUF4190 domain-containing protein [Amycolatopsis sp. NBC_01286]
MTDFDSYQQPGPAEPAWQQYPPSMPTPAPPAAMQPYYGTQPYPVQPYAAQAYPSQPYLAQPYLAQPYAMAAYPMLRTSGMAVAGMVVGILALIGFWVPFADLLLGFLAIGLSWAGIVQGGRPGYTGKGMAIAGLICGIIGVIPALIVMLFFFGLFAAAGACGIAC